MNKDSSPKEDVLRATGTVAQKTVFPVLMALSFSHLLNDTFQSLIPAMYPVLKDSYHLSFSQIGFITFTFQLTASVLQPVVGGYTDRNPKMHALSFGMCFTAIGLVCFAFAGSFAMLLVSVGIIGIGSSIFHPESSRVAHFASGGRKGMAQSLFQVGGRFGASLGPLLAAFIILPFGQFNIIWFAVAALFGAIFLGRVGYWYSHHHHAAKEKKCKEQGAKEEVSTSSFSIPRRRAMLALTVLLILTFSKYAYLASMTNYLTFYMIHEFGVSAQTSQIFLFIFMFAVAVGTYLGGPIGDRIGRKYVIWISILGVAPFTLLFPYVDLFWASALSVIIGLLLSSAFPAILVFAQDLMPVNLGMVSGLFYGFAFGIAGLGTVLLGYLADHTSIGYVFQVCSYFPLIGILAVFLPDLSDQDTEITPVH